MSDVQIVASLLVSLIPALLALRLGRELSQ